jgi:hypothetical protein
MQNTAPRWLLWVSILFLLWNLFGVAAFFMQWSLTAADIAKLPDAQQQMWAQMGPLTWVAYAVAVLSGTAGAAALLMRKKWALACFAISVIALLVQFSGPLGFAFGAGELQMMVFPIFIIAVAILELFLTRKWRNTGWLN